VPGDSNIKDLCRQTTDGRGRIWRIAKFEYAGRPLPLEGAQVLAAKLAENLKEFPHIVAVNADEPVAWMFYRVGSFSRFEYTTRATGVVTPLTFVSQQARAQQVIEMADAVLRAGRAIAGNVVLLYPEATDQVHILEFDELLDQLENVTWRTYLAMKANARRAKRMGTMTPVQASLLTYPSELDQYIAAREKMLSIMVPSSVGARFPVDFGDGCLGLVGVMWSSRHRRLEYCTLDQFVNTRLHKLRAAFFVGESEIGKSALQGALGKLFCIRTGSSFYILSKGLDALGLATRSGELVRAGAICLHDFELHSDREVALSIEEVKGLGSVYEQATFRARYHPAILPKYVPRLMSVNAGMHADGTVDWGSWFSRNNIRALAYLAREDVGGLSRLDDDMQAIVRRPVIFKIPHNGLNISEELFKDDLDEMVAREMARETEYYGQVA
jgi:hypothetical protein